MAKVTYRSDSLYRSTPIIKNKFLDILQSSISNKEEILTRSFIVESKYDHKPDKLAYDLYGNAKLWWVFAEFNPDTLKDPIIDFVSGLEIQVPVTFS